MIRRFSCCFSCKSCWAKRRSVFHFTFYFLNQSNLSVCRNFIFMLQELFLYKKARLLFIRHLRKSTDQLTWDWFSMLIMNCCLLLSWLFIQENRVWCINCIFHRRFRYELRNLWNYKLFLSKSPCIFIQHLHDIAYGIDLSDRRSISQEHFYLCLDVCHLIQ